MKDDIQWWSKNYTKSYSSFMTDDHQPPHTVFKIIHHDQHQYHRKKNHYITNLHQHQNQPWYGAVLVFKELGWYLGEITNVTQVDLPLIQCLLTL